MKELIERILSYLPQYLSDCGELLAGPKTFVARQLALAKDNKNSNCYLFLGVTIVLVTLISVFTPIHKEIYAQLISTGFVVFLTILVCSFCVQAAWFLVGGRTAFVNTFFVYVYVACPLMLISVCSTVIGWGFFRLIDSDAYNRLSATKRPEQAGEILLNSNASVVYYGFLAIGLLVATIYGFIAWGAFRNIYNLSKVKSAAAMILSSAFSSLVLVILFGAVAAVS
jgi:hypothetical protein